MKRSCVRLTSKKQNCKSLLIADCCKSNASQNTRLIERMTEILLTFKKAYKKTYKEENKLPPKFKDSKHFSTGFTSIRYVTFYIYQPSKTFCSIRLPNFFVNNSLLYFEDGRNRITFFICKFDFKPNRGSSFSRPLEDLKPTKFVT